MNAKKFLDKLAEERPDEGLWLELRQAVNNTAKLNSDQQRFLEDNIIPFLAICRLNKKGVNMETVFRFASYINSCK